MSRKSVSLDELFQILDGEYQRVKSPSCRSCVTPLPVRRSPADDVSTNWFVVDAQDCPHSCRVRLAEVVTRLMSEYELERSVYGVTRRPATKTTT